MALHPLRNDVWGFESNCFVCEAGNEAGLRISFAHDDETEMVVAPFNLDEAFSGAPSYVHGGLVLAILDEAQAWAAIAIAGKFAVTAETTSRFRHPVRCAADHRVEARVTRTTPRRVMTTARVVDAEGDVCVETEATFVVLSDAVAADAIGQALSTDERRFLRGPSDAAGAP
ncbi:MAG: PaaI family thioesterase [Acidimicrobiia bacterium]